MLENINLEKYWELILFFLPLGIIGVWRWSVWSVKKIISFFYKNPKGDFSSSLSIVTPVYNEDPVHFRAALNSWKDNYPDEIIAVIDHTDESSIRIFRQFKINFPSAKLIITHTPGKRPALAAGIRASQGEIVALVDSDTLWSPNIKNKILGPFADPRVGGIVTRQDVLEADTLSKKLFKILLSDRYLLEYPFLATLSDALLCLSGRTAVYRRSAIIDKLDKLVNETFSGRPMISGDDKTLTNLVQMDGWITRYLKNVVVYTYGNPTIFGFMKQKLRWARNGIRSDLRLLSSGWIWQRHKVLALHMLDKAVSPITLLLAPIFFILSLYFGHWEITLLIFSWWLLSRSIKIFPHLRENPRDIFILPDYILMTFVMAIVKIYAFFTLNEQGWITRWNKNRLVSMGFFKQAFSFVAVGTFIFILAFGGFSYKNYVLKKSETLAIQKAPVSIFTSDFPRMNDFEIQNIKADLSEKAQSDPYAYYTVARGDTLLGLRKKFNLSEVSEVFDAQTKTPLSRLAFLNVDQKLAFRVEDLRNPMDASVLRNQYATFPRVSYDVLSDTIFVRQAGSVVTLSSISRGLAFPYANLLEEIAEGEWILRSNLYVSKNITLIIDGEEVKQLRLKSDDKIVWIRGDSANILISNTKITSWNEKNGAPDENYADGRSYITATKNGRMDIINSELSYLGSVGFPKRGGLFGGSYGVSWKNRNGGYPNLLLTGVVVGNKFHHNYFGLYTYGVSGMLVQGNVAYENVEYGFDPHDDSNNMLIVENIARNNGNHGIIISRRCFNNIIEKNLSYDNRLHGIMLDRSSNNNLVRFNYVWGNVDGIAIYESNENLIVDNDVRDNYRGIRLNERSSRNYIENNEIIKNSRAFYIYNQAEENIAVNNRVKDNDIGITIKNASGNILLDNLKMFDNKKDGRITSDASGNNIQ